MSAPIVGFISPPDWFDPSPAEFERLSGGVVRVQQTLLSLPGFNWRIESIASSEPEQLQAARSLGAAGCDLIAGTGTPFGWAGLGSVVSASERGARLAAAAGAPCVLAGVAMVDALAALGVQRVGLACTYYSSDWRDHWAGYVTASGFEVLVARTLADHGLVPEHGAAEQAYWAPTSAQICESARRLIAEQPSIEVVAVSGAGARTLALVSELEAELGIPVIGADTALYWAIARRLDLTLPDGALGRLGRA